MTTILTLADAIRARLPDTPTFNLTVEPWIDVTDPDGTRPRQVGFAELLGDGHTMTLDDSRHGPLWRHAMQRLLIAFGHILHATDPTEAWTDIAYSQAPLSTAAVEGLLDRFASYLWLHHPTSPFLQDLTVIGTLKGAKVDPDAVLHAYWTLLPDIPAKSNSAWFNRQDERPAPTAADAANALVIRHMWALPGNETPNTIAGASTKGGAAALTHWGGTYATIDGDTVAQLIARNLLTDWTERITPDTTTFWEEPDGALAAVTTGNVLWAYTATMASTVLVPAPDRSDNYLVLRSPRPQPKTTAEQVKTFVTTSNPHTLRIDSTAKPPTPFKMVRLPVDQGESDLVRRFYGLAGSESDLHSPSLLKKRERTVRPQGRPTVQVLSIEGAGGSTGARISGAGTLAPGEADLHLDPAAARKFTVLANRILGASPSVVSVVSGAACRVRRADTKERRRPVSDATRAALIGASSSVLTDLLHACRDAATDADLPVGMTDAQAAQLVTAGLGVFDDLVAPFTHPTHVKEIVIQRRYLTRRLREALGDPR